MQFGEIADLCLTMEKFGIFKAFDIYEKTKYQVNAD